MSWPLVAFEALYAEPSRNGTYKSAEHHGAGTKIVNMGELFAHEFVGPQEMSRLAMSETELEKSGLLDGDLLFGRRSLVESGAGKCSVVEGLSEPTTFESSIIRVRPDKSVVVPRFYYYWFRSPLGRGAIRAIVSGTNVKGIRGSDLKKVLVPSPKREIQQSIADVLSAYDDLIENNRRRIKLLEESARLLYREWFVHLRFPGHEHVKIVDGVPEGWQQTTLGDVAENHDRLRVPLSVLEREKRRGAYPYYGAASLLDHVDGYLFDGRYLLLGEDGTVVTSEGAPMLQLVEGRFWVNNHAHVLTGKKAGLEFLYCCLSEYKIQGHITGVAQPKITQANMNRIPVLLPVESVLAEFQSSVEALFDQRFALERLNEKLRQARDLLLPRLMNGDLRIA